MGCCEGHGYSPYLLSPNTAAAYHSILLKEKRPSKNKQVRFTMSLTNFKQLNILEEISRPWYDSDLSQGSEWLSFKQGDSISMLYAKVFGKVLMLSKLSFQANIDHECIICLVNNPKYRNVWDTNLKKMDLLFGEANLDATISFLDKWENRSRLYERNVRKYGDCYYITYVPFDEALKDNFILFSIKEQKKLEVYWKEDISEDFEYSLEKNLQWAKMLYEEILVQRSSQ